MEPNLSPELVQWLEKNTPTEFTDAFGRCHDFVAQLVKEFPEELTAIVGYYHDPMWGPRHHAWCITSRGTIVDPTAGQFPSAGRGVYEPFGDHPPLFKCQNCGADVFTDEWYPFCCDSCSAQAYAEFSPDRFYP